MSFSLHKFGESVEVTAEPNALRVLATRPGPDLSRRESWPRDALRVAGGWRTAIEIEQLLEVGLAESAGGEVLVPYRNFREIDDQIPVALTQAWSHPSPFLLKIDRKSDIGRPDFLYEHQFLLGGRRAYGERQGYYVKRAGSGEIFRLDHQMYSLLEAMDLFNALPPERKTLQASWLTFAHIKGCAREVGAALDSTLQKNDVVIPSTIGLDLHEHEDGTLSFLPKCEDLASEDFQHVFERNSQAEKVYSIDRPGLGRIRVVLTDDQHEVLRRMKKFRHVRGHIKAQLLSHPERAFDGVLEHVELPEAPLPYGDRVIGIGEFQFAPIPKRASEDSAMSDLWRDDRGARENAPNGGQEAGSNIESILAGCSTTVAEPTDPGEIQADSTLNRTFIPVGASDREQTVKQRPPRNVLLIDTNEEFVKPSYLDQAQLATSAAATEMGFERPESLMERVNLDPHQEQGVRWLQTCVSTPDRKGVLLADDMGLGKTLQILSFLAWCIESGRFPDLARPSPPYRPILIVVPLILLENRTWETEMERFFADQGAVFSPVDQLHGSRIGAYRRKDVDGSEFEAMRPALDLARLQKNRVIITNYETLKNYQYSFAYCPEGKSPWSAIISDEAQEYKIPGTKISHAMKTLKADFQIACTGTPVENRLLDLWNIYDVVQPGLLASAKEFIDQFESRLRGSARDGSLTELKQRLFFQQPHAFLLRRNKSELASLPPKNLVKLQCPMSEEEIALHQNLLAELRDNDKPTEHLKILHRFAQLYQHPALLSGEGEEAEAARLIGQSSKLRTVIKALHQIRVRREKVIIFARHRAMQAILAKTLETEFETPVKIINGLTKSGTANASSRGKETRTSILKSFREKPGFHILILSPFVAGIGLTITEANHVIHYGRWWNPATESQATDRAYRKGQTKEVFVYIPILHDPSRRIDASFDEQLDVLMSQKHRLSEDFLSPLPEEMDLAADLYRKLKVESSA
jgi:hypothetical protein